MWWWMRLTRWLHVATFFILGAGALVLFLALVAPSTQADENSQISDSDETVVVHGFLDGLAAAPPTQPTLQADPRLAGFALPAPHEAPRATLVARATTPRAPPIPF